MSNTKDMMKSYSLTHAGVLVSVVGTAAVAFLMRYGLSEEISNELVSVAMEVIPAVVGGIMSWVGRVRAGGVTMLGIKH